MMRKIFLLFAVVPIVALVAGCGGGGGGVSKPPAPTNFKADRVWVKNGTDLSQKVTLNWDSVNGAQSYKIYIKVEGGTTSSLLREVSSPPYTYNLSSDLYSLDIDYFVSAVVNGVEGEQAQHSATAPPPPSPFSP
jgi:hypothetical protein